MYSFTGDSYEWVSMRSDLRKINKPINDNLVNEKDISGCVNSLRAE